MSDVRSRARRVVAGPTKRTWRTVRKVLPAAVAKPLRLAVRRGLRAAGLLGTPAARPAPIVAPATAPTPVSATPAREASSAGLATAAPNPEAAELPSSDTPEAEPAAPADPAECPLCGTVADGFLPFGVSRVLPERRCPTCGSLERHRAVWLYFQRKTNLFTDPVRMLHLAPEAFLSERLSTFDNIDYLTADLTMPTVMVKMDITDIQYPDDSFDVIFASDVLEHIPDDELAMRELRRVLRPGGWAVLQVPIWGPKTREDPTVVDPKERTRLFGQYDHVRLYGHDGEYEGRLRRSGFDVTVDRFAVDMGPEACHRFRLRDHEDIYFCRKSAP